MRNFYGGTYIGKEELIKNNIYYPIRLEYYKTEKVEKGKSIYGIEIIKTDYKNEQVNIESKVLYDVTYDEYKIIEVLELLRQGSVTPIALEEIVGDIMMEEDEKNIKCISV